jgi:outer membrane protein assembly factor BamA
MILILRHVFLPAFCFVCTLLATAPFLLHAQNTDLGKVQSIEIQGLQKTKPSVILNEIDFAPGQQLTQEVLDRSLLRLQNLIIFEDITFEVLPLTQDTIKVTITVDERWTLLPIAKVIGSGGSTSITLGAYDVNFLGRFYEVGLQYDNVNGQSGGVTWFRNRRLFGTRVTIGYDLWLNSRNRYVYGNDETIDGGFTLNRRTARFFSSKEVHYNFEYGGGVVLDHYWSSEDGLSDAQVQNNQDNGFMVPITTTQWIAEFFVRLGKINTDVYLDRGFETTANLRLTKSGVLNSDLSWYQWEQRIRWFQRIGHHHNFGAQLRYGSTNASPLTTQFFLGGNETVRGLLDGHVIAQHFVQANAEYRIHAAQASWVILQPVVFADALMSNTPTQNILDAQAIASVGGGIRFISPKIARLNIRLDVGQTFGRIRALNVSFGLQQFF